MHFAPQSNALKHVTVPSVLMRDSVILRPFASQMVQEAFVHFQLSPAINFSSSYDLGLTLNIDI